MLISRTSEALTGLLIDTNDSTLTSPGAEASGFQNSFSGLYSVLEQILPIYWRFSTLPVTSTCSHFQPLSDGGQQHESQPVPECDSAMEGNGPHSEAKKEMMWYVIASLGLWFC